MNYNILELYSGIGGMHCALKESEIDGNIVAAIDINSVANEVYKHNYPETHLINRNIQSIKLEELKRINANTILMSPPCQPFTRNGKYLDKDDPRTDSFIYLLSILNQLDTIKYILLENVKGFECSVVRNLFVSKLQECKFAFQEFLLCPSTVGIPNSRLRYYCIARRTTSNWNFETKDEIILNLPKDYGLPHSIEFILEKNVPNSFMLTEKQLRQANVLDLCYRDSKRSCCFTKAYTHYMEGTGSVFTDARPLEVKQCYSKAKMFKKNSEEFTQSIKELNIRFFTPKEIMLLMAFPKSYSFPDNITLKQCYRLLGNSVNVKVVSELLKILLD